MEWSLPLHQLESASETYSQLPEARCTSSSRDKPPSPFFSNLSRVARIGGSVSPEELDSRAVVSDGTRNACHVGSLSPQALFPRGKGHMNFCFKFRPFSRHGSLSYFADNHRSIFPPGSFLCKVQNWRGGPFVFMLPNTGRFLPFDQQCATTESSSTAACC